jgi:hypothetical protein
MCAFHPLLLSFSLWREFTLWIKWLGHFICCLWVLCKCSVISLIFTYNVSIYNGNKLKYHICEMKAGIELRTCLLWKDNFSSSWSRPHSRCTTTAKQISLVSFQLEERYTILIRKWSTVFYGWQSSNCTSMFDVSLVRFTLAKEHKCSDLWWDGAESV